MKPTFAVVLVVLAVGCGKKHDAPALSGSDIEALRDEPVKAAPAPGGSAVISEAEYLAMDHEMTTKLVDIYKADGSDCDKLATDITAVAADTKLAAMDAYEQAHPEFQPTPDAATDALVKTFQDAAARVREKCAGNKRYLDALMKF